MIDLKLDIGWHRNSFFKELGKYSSICNKMKKAKKLTGKNGNVEDEKKPKIIFTINDKIAYDVVVISSRNSEKNENMLINASNNKDLNVWVLSTGGSLNQYEHKKEIEVNKNDYIVFLDKIKNNLSKQTNYGTKNTKG